MQWNQEARYLLLHSHHMYCCCRSGNLSLLYTFLRGVFFSNVVKCWKQDLAVVNTSNECVSSRIISFVFFLRKKESKDPLLHCLSFMGHKKNVWLTGGIVEVLIRHNCR